MALPEQAGGRLDPAISECVDVGKGGWVAWRMRLATGLCRSGVGALVLAAFSYWLAVEAQAASPLTNVAAVKLISAEAARTKIPVRLHGVVTAVNPRGKDVFLQDGTGAVYIAGDDLLNPLKVGDLADLEGVTDPGSFAPIVLPRKVQVVGRAALPAPVPATRASLADGRFDAERVVIEAEVLGIAPTGPDLRLNLMMPDGSAIALLANRSLGELPARLRRATVRLTGVAAPGHNGQRQATVARILVSSLDPIEILRPGPEDPDNIPFSLIGGLLRFNLHEGSPNSTRIRGIVTAVPSSERFFLQDESGAVLVSLGQEESAGLRSSQLGKAGINPGDQIEVMGGPFVERLSVLFRADELRALGRAELPQGVALAPEDVADPRYNWRRVSFEGRVLAKGRSALSGRLELTAKSGTAVVVADLPNIDPGRLVVAVGSLVRIQGVLDSRNRAEWNSDVSMIHLASPADLTVLEGPPANPIQLLLLIVAGVFSAGALVLVWALLLRRQVRIRTMSLARTNASLQASQEWQRLAIEATKLGLWDWDLATGKLDCPGACQAIWGGGPGVFPGTYEGFTGHVHPDDLPGYQQGIERALALNEPFHYEHRVLWPDGSLRWVSSHGKHVRDGQANGSRMIGTVLDITDRKRADLALRQSEAEFRAMFEVASIGIGQADASSGIWLRVNQKLCDITGYSAQEMQRMSLSAITHPEDRGKEQEGFEAVVSGESPDRRLEERYFRKDGTVAWVNVNLTAIQDSDGRPVRIMAAVEDISDRKRLEEQLRQAQKLEAIGQLAGGVAHDFNNILAAILMQNGLLQMNPALDEETRAGLTEIGNEAQRAASLTRQLLMFSRRAVLDVRPLDLGEIVDNLLKMLCRLIGEHVKLELGERTPLPLVEADGGMMEQVVTNLVVNARDAMPRGGKVSISTAVADFSEAQAPPGSIRRVGRFVCLTVSDTGCGMDSQTLERIFEPFFTTKEMGKGTGLGLATVHGIVAQHKGWVEVESEPAVGSTFRIYLPALPGSQAKASGSASRQKSQIVGGKEAILVVEDQLKVRAALAQTLRACGYSVYEASNGQEALALWPQHAAQIDLLFTDMIMPEGLTGLELTERLQAMKPELKVIISSGYNSEIAPQSPIAKTGFLYLPKPYEISVLVEAVRNCLDQK